MQKKKKCTIQIRKRISSLIINNLYRTIIKKDVKVINIISVLITNYINPLCLIYTTMNLILLLYHFLHLH